MDYRIVKGTKPTLASYNKYTAKAVHYNTLTAKQLQEEIEHSCSATAADVILVLGALQDVLIHHLRNGDKVTFDLVHKDKEYKDLYYEHELS